MTRNSFPESSREPYDSKSKTHVGIAVISIVDDDALARDGLAEWVESMGFEVETFVSAEQFIETGGIARTQCVITDLHMPGMSGIDLQRRLRAEGHRTPVIVMTAYPNEQHRVQAFEDGATGFLIKPLREHSLVECLEQATGCKGFA
jgi:FixJ family two-component response regulator